MELVLSPSETPSSLHPNARKGKLWATLVGRNSPKVSPNEIVEPSPNTQETTVETCYILPGANAHLWVIVTPSYHPCLLSGWVMSWLETQRCLFPLNCPWLCLGFTQPQLGFWCWKQGWSLKPVDLPKSPNLNPHNFIKKGEGADSEGFLSHVLRAG